MAVSKLHPRQVAIPMTEEDMAHLRLMAKARCCSMAEMIRYSVRSAWSEHVHEERVRRWQPWDKPKPYVAPPKRAQSCDGYDD